MCHARPAVQVFVAKRTGAEVPMTPGRDIDLDYENENV